MKANRKDITKKENWIIGAQIRDLLTLAAHFLNFSFLNISIFSVSVNQSLKGKENNFLLHF